MLHTSLHFKKNTFTAALLVAVVSLATWYIFNLFVQAYPPMPSTYQTTQQQIPTPVDKLGYPYRVTP